jgi:xanthine dehydrogenase accessory factor
MIVSASGYHGSIGGGALEWQAMAEAQAMLAKGIGRKESQHVLGPDLGQCCGGRVRLVLQAYDVASIVQVSAEALPMRGVMVFGAGHVGRALVMAVAGLPLAVRWVDGRSGAFPAYIPQNVVTVQSDDPVAELVAASGIVLVMTHSHALDLEIVDAALRNLRVVHVGLIGSETKRARFVSRLTDAGISAAQFGKLICPIGIAGISGKEPGVIAASTVAQLLVLDEALRQGDQIERHAQLSA